MHFDFTFLQKIFLMSKNHCLCVNNSIQCISIQYCLHCLLIQKELKRIPPAMRVDVLCLLMLILPAMDCLPNRPSEIGPVITIKFAISVTPVLRFVKCLSLQILPYGV